MQTSRNTTQVTAKITTEQALESPHIILLPNLGFFWIYVEIAIKLALIFKQFCLELFLFLHTDKNCHTVPPVTTVCLAPGASTPGIKVSLSPESFYTVMRLPRCFLGH